jgi:hypothetical protein
MTHLASHRQAAHPPGEVVLALRRLSGDLAILSTVGSVVALYAISAITMEHFGIAYITSGGGPLSKVHPAFLLAVAALAFRCLASHRPLQAAWRLVSSDAGVVLLSFSIVLTAFYAAAIAKVPYTGVLDAFVLPMLLFLLLRDLDPSLRRWLALLVGFLLCVNGVMAIIEFYGGFHFIRLEFDPTVSADPTHAGGSFDLKAAMALDWRPFALLGHPLVNGLIVQSAICCLLARGARWLPWIVKGPVLVLLCTSLVTLGARTSLVFTLVVGSCFVLDGWCRAVSRGARLQPQHVAIAFIAIAVAALAIFAGVDAGIFDRTIERFASDQGSAATRLVMFEMFKPLSWNDIVFGPDKDVVATWQRLEGLEFGIESSWVGLILTYGLAVTLMIITGLLAFSRSVVRASGPGATFILVVFFLTVSGSASLSGKTTVFAATTVLIQLFLSRDGGAARQKSGLPPRATMSDGP